MFDFKTEDNTLDAAKKFDQKDPLNHFREKFSFPVYNEDKSGDKGSLYFAGHSLGLCPDIAYDFIKEELEDWRNLGVEGHFDARHPWLPYHEFITESFSKLVGAKNNEVVAMNTLTVNLHLMLVSFYRPTKTKFKILIENNTFPSDKYAVDSQARYHGFDPNEAIVQLKPREGELQVRPEDVLQQIEDLGDELALVMLGNCNYLSGQCFDMAAITKLGHEKGAKVGFNLAHGVGNLVLNLHDWDVDFAVWCTYKYLNSGPGGIAGAFVHQNHLNDPAIPRFEGWWGTNKDTRFQMGPNFDPIPSVEAWQLSNPPIWQLASLRASMTLFDEATMPEIRKKGDHLTGYLEWLLNQNCGEAFTLMTPNFDKSKQARGSMLCLRMKKDPRQMMKTFKKRSVIADFREPDIIRIAPAPLYNSYSDVYNLVKIIEECVNE